MVVEWSSCPGAAWQMATAGDSHSLVGIETAALARSADDTEREFELQLAELRSAGQDRRSATCAAQLYQARQTQARVARLAEGLAQRAGEIASEAERGRLCREIDMIVLGGMEYRRANSLIDVAASAAEEIRRRALHGQLVAAVGEQALNELLKPAPGEAAAEGDIDGDLYLYRESPDEELATFWEQAAWALIESCQRGSRIAIAGDSGTDSGAGGACCADGTELLYSSEDWSSED